MRANLERGSPFKSLVESGKVPAAMYSPEMSDDEERSFGDGAGAPSKLMGESDEDRGWVGEDEEAGGYGESLAIGIARFMLP
jgi:hypothetical protein